MEIADPPLHVEVELTSRCNLSCAACPRTSGATRSSLEPGDMSPELSARVIESVRGCPNVSLIGFGEPTLHPHFLRMLRALDGLGIRSAFSTNGTTVTVEGVRRLAELEHLRHVNVSIDSPDPSIYRDVRGGKLDIALRGVRLLREGLPSRIDLHVTALVAATTLDSLLSFPPILADLGVTRLFLGGIYEMTEGMAPLRPHALPRFAERLEAIAAAGRELGVAVVLACEADPDKADLYYRAIDPGEPATRHCILPWTQPFIDKDGFVFPCVVTGHQAAMGNISSADLNDIWNDRPFRAFRAGLCAGGPRLPEVCRTCSQRPRADAADFARLVRGLCVDDHITMGDNDERHLDDGWHPLERLPEPARWTSDQAYFRIRSPGESLLVMEVGLVHARQRVVLALELDGVRVGSFRLGGPCRKQLRFPSTGTVGVVRGRIAVEPTWVPASAGLPDSRHLGAAIYRLAFERQSS